MPKGFAYPTPDDPTCVSSIRRKSIYSPAHSPTAIRALPIVAAYTGLRWGELAGLRIAAIVMLRRRLTVRTALIEAAGEAPRLGRPKTAASERTITLPGISLDAIAQHIDRYPLVDGLMWTTERGAYLRRGSFSRI